MTRWRAFSGRSTDPVNQVRWRCTKCGTAFRGTPRQRLLDARDRWRRDRCRSCQRTTFMEREGPSTPRAKCV
jgi:hypothetical protein